jgi:hypothetical protein
MGGTLLSTLMGGTLLSTLMGGTLLSTLMELFIPPIRSVNYLFSFLPK